MCHAQTGIDICLERHTKSARKCRRGSRERPRQWEEEGGALRGWGVARNGRVRREIDGGKIGIKANAHDDNETTASLRTAIPQATAWTRRMSSSRIDGFDSSRWRSARPALRFDDSGHKPLSLPLLLPAEDCAVVAIPAEVQGLDRVQRASQDGEPRLISGGSMSSNIDWSARRGDSAVIGPAVLGQ